jgi:hypothetical protein
MWKKMGRWYAVDNTDKKWNIRHRTKLFLIGGVIQIAVYYIGARVQVIGKRQQQVKENEKQIAEIKKRFEKLPDGMADYANTVFRDLAEKERQPKKAWLGFTSEEEVAEFLRGARQGRPVRDNPQA